MREPDCSHCTLPGQKLVWGRGEPAGLFIVGEAPGPSETIKLAPLIGAGGDLLKTCLARCGWGETPTYTTLSVMCQPPGGRSPSEHEVKCCAGRLQWELEEVRPTKLLVLGAVACKALFGVPLNRVRGKRMYYQGIPTIVTYHPNYILRNPDAFLDFEFDIDKLHTEYEDFTEVSKRHYVIKDEEQIMQFLCMCEGIISLDIETTGLNEHQEEITRIGIRDDFMGSAVLYAPISNEVAKGIERMSQRCKVICHNVDFEYRWLRAKLGIKLQCHADIMLMHHAIDERTGMGVSRSLKTLGKAYFDLDDWSGVVKNAGGFKRIEGFELDSYLAQDLWVTRMLYDKLLPLVIDEKQEGPFFNITMPVRHTLSEMSSRGIYADREYLTELDWKLGSLADASRLKIEELVGSEFNPASPAMVADLLFNKMKLPKVRGDSTAKGVLEQMNEPIADLILDFRAHMKTASTYVQGLASVIQADGKIHTKFNQHRATTYRLSSDDPNLQNIPQRNKVVAKLVRDVFYAPEGWELLEIDYSQLEVFIMAILAKDDRMIEVLGSGLDIYTHVASVFYQVAYAEVTREQRQSMKDVVLGAIYDRRAEAIAAAHDTPVPIAQAWLDAFFSEFKGVRRFLDEQPKRAMQLGYSETLYGRRRRFPFITGTNKLEVMRQSINSPDQGTGVDICCLAMHRIEQLDMPIQQLVQIHDAILAYVPTDRFDECKEIMMNEMTKAPFETPLNFRVECKRGNRWGSMVSA